MMDLRNAVGTARLAEPGSGEAVLLAEVDRLKQMIHNLRSEIAIRDTELDGMRMELANRQIERME